MSDLSGGNQQKIAVARLLHHDVDVFLLDEPTRGIDVGSKAEIYRLIDELACRGKAILMVSSYLPELLGRVRPDRGDVQGPAGPVGSGGSNQRTSDYAGSHRRPGDGMTTSPIPTQTSPPPSHAECAAVLGRAVFRPSGNDGADRGAVFRLRDLRHSRAENISDAG